MTFKIKIINAQPNLFHCNKIIPKINKFKTL